MGKKNITKPCSRDDFPTGTVWLLNEHKLCVQELQKLKTMIDDLHRYIDLIHQRGQALFNAYNALRTKLGDIRREISIIGRKNHDAEQTIKRLRVELEDWKSKTQKMQEELNLVKAQYKELERHVEEQREKERQQTALKEQLVEEQKILSAGLEKVMKENKDLKISLLNSERYKEEFRELSEYIDMIRRKLQETEDAIKKTKEDLQAARMEGVMPKTKYLPPKFNKDTKVNLDMSMWIVHNISKEEREPYYPKIEMKPYTEPYYPPPTTKYEEPTTTYAEPEEEEEKYEEEPKYEEAPKYEEPPKYEQAEKY